MKHKLTPSAERQESYNVFVYSVEKFIFMIVDFNSPNARET